MILGLKVEAPLEKALQLMECQTVHRAVVNTRTVMTMKASPMYMKCEAPTTRSTKLEREAARISIDVRSRLEK
jgi:hypothetical protein